MGKMPKKRNKKRVLQGEVSRIKYRVAVSAIVATVLLVLITVATGSIVWFGVSPVVTQSLQLNDACAKARLWVDTQSGYTCYDAVNKQVMVMVSRGPEEYNLQGVSVGLLSAGKTTSKEIREGSKQNMLLYLPLDEGSGITTADTSGNNNLAEIFNAVWATGKYSNALMFDGIDDYANSTMTGQYGDEITVELWIAPNSTSWQNIIGKENSFYVETNGSDANASFYINGGWK